MNKLAALTVMLLTSVIALHAASGTCTITPTSVKIGEIITVTYSSSDQLGRSDSIGLQCAVYRKGDTPLLLEQLMAREGNTWKGTLSINDPTAVLLACRFVSGDQTDDNGGLLWVKTIDAAEGKSVEGAHAEYAVQLAYGGFYPLKGTKNAELAAAELAKERVLHPANWRPDVTEWNVKTNQGTDAAEMKAIFESFAANHQSDDEALGIAADWIERAGDTLQAERLRATIIERNPKGVTARNIRGYKALREKNADTRQQLLEAFLSDFNDLAPAQKANYVQRLCVLYAQKKEYEKVDKLLNTEQHLDPMLFNQLAWPLVESGEQLERAIDWAAKGVAGLRNPDPTRKPSYMAEKSWKENTSYQLGMVLDTYAYALAKIGKFEEARQSYAEVYRLMDGGDGETNARYLDAVVKSGKYEEAMSVGREMMRRGKDSPEVVDQMKIAFAHLEGGREDYGALRQDQQKKFEEIVSVESAAKRVELVKKVKESRISKPAVDFTLKDMDGNPVTLSTLKGKVVVIDFWATWCGPCRKSFPDLQKVYDAYKSNADVKIFAIDTWERLKSYEETVANAQKFIQENKYTFPVLIDEKIVDKYDVEGIPTKFIIDRSGKIAFETIGYNGPEMVDELSAQLEILLSE